MAAGVRIASLVAASLFIAACTGDGGGRPDPSIDEPTPCPALDSARRVGTVGGEGDEMDLAAQGISGLGVGRFDQTTTSIRDDEPIAWAVGDRFANELAGDDSVLLFALDPRNGNEISRFKIDSSTLEPGPGGDPVTSLEGGDGALPDFEDLSVEPRSDEPDRLWLFDTGNNEGDRDHLNAYVVNSPARPGIHTGVIAPARYPFQLGGLGDYPALNTEAAIADAARGDSPTTVYLIPKFPVDLADDGTGDDFPVYAFEPDLENLSGETNEAVIVGHITLDDPELRVTAASASRDGTAFAIRAVSGGEEGQPNLDQVALWRRDPTASITDVLAAHPTPHCIWSFDTAKRSSAEETLAFDLGGGPAWSGLLWTHDQRDPGAPLFSAPRR